LRSDNVHRRRQLARGARAGGGPVPWQVNCLFFRWSGFADPKVSGARLGDHRACAATTPGIG